MRLVPWWALLASGSTPVLLVAGWSIAALLQGPRYDPATQTISILAADGASGYWVMTGAVVGLGSCHVITAWGLRAAASAGRVALGGGGLSAIALALFPAPSSGGSLGHAAVVVVGFVLLAVWPLLAARRGANVPWGLRVGPSVMASALMWIGGAWFLIELMSGGAAGAAERVITFEQSVWPFVVVASCLRQPRSDVRTT